MRLSYEPITLELETPFRIAHGVSTARHNVLLCLDDGDHKGLGEAAPVRQHHETQQGVMDYLAALPSLPDDPFQLEDILATLPPGSQAARTSVDLALHDLLGRKLDLPLYKLLGLNPANAPETSLTIGLGPVEEVRSGVVDLHDDWVTYRAAPGTSPTIVTGSSSSADAGSPASMHGLVVSSEVH